MSDILAPLRERVAEWRAECGEGWHSAECCYDDHAKDIESLLPALQQAIEDRVKAAEEMELSGKIEAAEFCSRLFEGQGSIVGENSDPVLTARMKIAEYIGDLRFRYAKLSAIGGPRT